MSYRTYDEWKNRGRQVQKGEKSVGSLNDGTKLFSKNQTKKIKQQSKNTNYNEYYYPCTDYYHDDEYNENGIDIGLPGQW